ncbi:MAG: aspartate-semialdehyde dehydrogenase [Armatimonadetes bacterium]|nr:aspartate-semialdehyde dehydrogenase [Armatimonadota bacterium]
MSRLKAAVVGATGLAGQQFLTALADHPLFDVTVLAASARTAGKKYKDAIKAASGAVQWFCTEPLAEQFAEMTVQLADDVPPTSVDVVFTALESDAAAVIEPRFAEYVPVLSTASAFRYEDDVPVLIPGVNAHQLPLLRAQQARRGWKGFVAPNPNCTTVGLAMTLAPLHERFGVQSVLMTSMQGVSGAGRSPGVIALDIIDNVIPHIKGEEEKVEAETRKILGTLTDAGIEPAPFRVSATCTRVPVLESHTESVYVGLNQAVTLDEVKQAWAEWGRDFVALGHYTSPKKLITYHEDPFRPQPRIDRLAEDGMTTSVGRLREDSVLPNGIKYVLVSHNTKMGAAKGVVLMGEELARQGYIG